MNKVKRMCTQSIAKCADGTTVEIYETISDFYEGDRLFVCPHCGEMYAVNRDDEYYAKKTFESMKDRLFCAQCQKPLSDVLPHPDYYWCMKSQTIERFARLPDVPLEGIARWAEFWNPLD